MITEDRIAQLLGAHATAAFLLTLAVVLAAVCAAWLLIRHVERRHGPDPLPPARLLILRLVAGFGIAAAAGTAFVEIADELDVSEDLARFDQALADSLREHVSPAALGLFAAVTRLGDTATLTVLGAVVAGLLLAVSRRRLALVWMLALAGNGALNVLLKGLFERVRPVRDHELVAASGWSFPSGHSSGSVVAYGMLAYVATRFLPPRWQLPALLAAATVALTVGLSRVFLQVHYLSDVLAGFASGLLWLAICIVSSEWWHSRFTPGRSSTGPG